MSSTHDVVGSVSTANCNQAASGSQNVKSGLVYQRVAVVKRDAEEISFCPGTIPDSGSPLPASGH
ncbi:hypothetical protein D6D38_24575 [Rahnella variigena]|nr:hypothetical protein D6D38_24575 [Rahnella variigena]